MVEYVPKRGFLSEEVFSREKEFKMDDQDL